ncbi:MAG: response regulator [Methylococcales bacterium]|nr:response regulator [Methylococcales bacterium]
MNELILIVEDEPLLAMLLANCVSSKGFSSHCIFDGADVVDWVKKYQPDLILMDVMLPNCDGITLCREIRKFSSVPLFFISSCISEFDRLRGLNSGADDYICKPYNPNEVLARINAIFRRIQNFSPNQTEIAGFVLNKESFQAYYKDKPLNLTLSEFRILAMLLSKKDKVYSRSMLLEVLHEDEYDGLNRTIDGHIKNIRQKIKNISNDQEVIATVYGMGYRIIH